MRNRYIMLFGGFAATLLLFFADLSVGSLQIPLKTVWESVWGIRATDSHTIVATIRLPRSVFALAVGAGLAAAGVCMQAMTRNPLASPELLGANNGAAFAIVLLIAALPGVSGWSQPLAAFAGAALASSVIFYLTVAGSKRVTPVKLILAGTAISLMLGSLTQGVLLLNERSIDEMRFWLAGSVAGRDFAANAPALVPIAAGIAAALLAGKQMNALQLGDEVSSGLGVRTFAARSLLFVLTVVLSAACVTIAGPIAFVGLAMPHIARGLCGPDYRWIAVHSVWLGASMMLAADIASKLVIYPGEVPIGVMTLIMGAPFFIHLARKKEWRLE